MVSLASLWETTFDGINGTNGLKNHGLKKDVQVLSNSPSKIPDDETSLNTKEEEKLECPICFEPFDTSKNVPHVLWCGHTLCNKCVLGLQRAVVKFQKLCPIVLPFFVTCPWCKILSLRLFYKGKLKFPSKNYFVLWMVDNYNAPTAKEIDDQMISYTTGKPVKSTHPHEPLESDQNGGLSVFTLFNAKSLLIYLCKSFSYFACASPIVLLVSLLLFVVLCAIPVNAAIVVIFLLIALSLIRLLVPFYGELPFSFQFLG